jgi:hypothetical protein
MDANKSAGSALFTKQSHSAYQSLEYESIQTKKPIGIATDGLELSSSLPQAEVDSRAEAKVAFVVVVQVR